MDLEKAVHTAGCRIGARERKAAIDDGGGRAETHNGHGCMDVEVTGRVEVIVDRWNAKCVDSGADRDRICAGRRVCLHDRGAQCTRSAARGAHAVAGIRIHQVSRAVNGK